jgi:itaconate CoA-transferase
MPGDLADLLVVSVEQAVAAPYLTSRLADAGARVIKIERPEGDFARDYDGYVNGESAYFVWLNRGKESIRLDLKGADDAAILRAMIGRADIFVENLAPGALARLGFEPADLRRADPRLITCSISGYGEDGPFRDQKAYDLLIQAETGLAEITGTPEGRARVGVSVCDIAAGMTALQGVLQAVIGRMKDGKGRHVAVSLFHALGDWMNVPYLQHVYGGITPQRVGLVHPTIAPYGAYRCGDGKDLLISIQNAREWRVLAADILDDAALADDPRFAANGARIENRAQLDEIVGAAFARRSREEMVARLEAARIAYGRVSTLDDLVHHPQNRTILVQAPSGPVRMLAPGATHDGQFRVADRVPALGEHEASLRREFAAAAAELA